MEGLIEFMNFGMICRAARLVEEQEEETWEVKGYTSMQKPQQP